MGSGTPGITGTRGTSPQAAGPLGRRARIWLWISAVVLLVGLGCVTVWAVLDPGRYSSSGDGCVALTIPNSTGGAVLHACGDPARTLCRSAFSDTDRIALLLRAQCDIAGLGATTGAQQ
ncbi:MAG: hypothetical protein QOF00_870 [Pseudonocardiales bacterium]|jgi:hypothetical protein|nr:hypothetical protein [Pseudonocardiales bacterium]